MLQLLQTTDISMGLFKTPSDRSIWVRVFFLDSFRLVLDCLLHPLAKSDLRDLRDSVQPDVLEKKYHDAKQSLPRSNRRHRRVLFKMLQAQILLGAILAIFTGILTAYLTILVKQLITYITERGKNSELAYTNLVWWVVLTILRVFLLQNSVRVFHEVGLKCDMITSNCVMQKVADIPMHEKHAVVKSQVLGIFLLDVKTVNSFFKTAHFVFLSPTTFLLAIALIFREGWYLGFVLVHAIVVIMVIMYFVNEEIRTSKARKIKTLRHRINTNIEFLSQIKELKTLGWEELLESKTKEYEGIENIQNLDQNQLLRLYEMVIILCPVLILAVIFLTNYLQGDSVQTSLPLSVIYVVFNFIYLTRSPLKSIRTVVMSIYDLTVALDRIESFLKIESVPLIDFIDKSIAVGSVEINSLITLNRRGSFLDSNLRRQSVEPNRIVTSSNQQTQLEITFRIHVKPGERLIILSTKNQGSVLLECIAGHFKKNMGDILYNGKLGYVSSHLWFSSKSIRDNITFGKCYNKKKLNNALYTADLNQQVKLYERRQETPIDSDNYFSLSQRSRISYARTIYTDPDIFLLDDTFRTMNRATIETLNNRMASKLSTKTFLIATNSLYCPSLKDKILVFRNGKSVEYGVYGDLLGDPTSAIHNFYGFDTSPYKSKEFIEQQRFILKKQRTDNFLYKLSRRLRRRTYWRNLLKLIKENGKEYIYRELDKLKQIPKEEIVVAKEPKQEIPKTGLDLYPDLISYGFTSLTILNYILIWMQQATALFIIWSLGYLSLKNLQHHQLYVYAFFAIVIFYISIVVVQNNLDVYLAKEASSNLNKHMVSSIIKAKPQHFEKSPLFVATDKLNQDYTKTFDIYSKFSKAMRNLSIFSVTLVLMVIESPNFLVHAVWLFAFNLAFLFCIYRVERKVCSLYSEFCFSLNSSIENMYDGIQTNKFYSDPLSFTSSQKVSIYEYCIYRHHQRQIFYVNNIVSSYSTIFLVWVLALYAINNAEQLRPASAIYVGAAINYALRISGVLSNFNQDVVSAEISITKILNKVFHYISLPPESNYDTPKKPIGWPKRITLEIERVSLKRTKDSSITAIKDMSLRVEDKARVCLFGRGTSGIYSIFPAITRILRVGRQGDDRRGRILIDGVDIDQIGRKYLMEEVFHLVSVPFVYTASLRLNIDPFDEFHSSEIIRLLRKLNVSQLIKCQDEDLLDYHVVYEQTPLPLKQIINIVRAILRTPSLLLCESIEPSTTKALAEVVISEQLPHSTILFINPHLYFIESADRVIFISNGRIVEDGSPVDIFNNIESSLAKQIYTTEPLRFQQLQTNVSLSQAKISKRKSSRMESVELLKVSEMEK